jgi:hypothetical protein
MVPEMERRALCVLGKRSSSEPIPSRSCCFIVTTTPTFLSFVDEEVEAQLDASGSRL